MPHAPGDIPLVSFEKGPCARPHGSLRNYAEYTVLDPGISRLQQERLRNVHVNGFRIIDRKQPAAERTVAESHIFHGSPQGAELSHHFIPKSFVTGIQSAIPLRFTSFLRHRYYTTLPQADNRRDFGQGGATAARHLPQQRPTDEEPCD